MSGSETTSISRKRSPSLPPIRHDEARSLAGSGGSCPNDLVASCVIAQLPARENVARTRESGQRLRRAFARSKRDSYRVRNVTARDGPGFIPSHAVAEEGHRQSSVGVSPADRGAEPAVPEGAHRAGRTGPMPPWIGQPTQLEPESAADRHFEGAIDIAVNLDAQHSLDCLRAENARAVERPASGQCRIEAGHVAGSGESGRCRNDRSTDLQAVEALEDLALALIRALGGMEEGRTLHLIFLQADYGVDHLEWAGDFRTQIVPVCASIEAVHEFGADPLLSQVMVRADGTRFVTEWHVFDGPNRPGPVTPAFRRKRRWRQWEATAVREHMPEGDSRFAIPGEGRPVLGDRIIESRGAPLDLLPEGD